jgi:glutamyl-tRNA synthetase
MVIVRSDGTPVFHLANVVDDIEMAITHIIRGDDHVENTYKHIPLFRALGAEPPKYAHLPMIVNAQGQPYSKRDGAAFVGEFREQGFLAGALFNYLALLGWSPGEDREKMSMQEMIESFTLERIKSGPAQMDLRKLTHMNQLYVEAMPLDNFISSVKSALPGEAWLQNADPSLLSKTAALMQSRTHLFTFARAWKCFFSDEFEVDEKSVRKLLAKPGVAAALSELASQIESGEFTESGIEAALRRSENKSGISEGKLNQPVRIAVTGTPAGAGIYETMALLGRDTCLRRLRFAAVNMAAVPEEEAQ